MAARSDTAVDAHSNGLNSDGLKRLLSGYRPLSGIFDERMDSGVFYRVYGDPAGAERPWPLSHVPLIINPAEWAELKSGLIQRAELLELVLKDAYGPATIVRDGLLPAVLIAGNPEFLRPLVGVA